MFPKWKLGNVISAAVENWGSVDGVCVLLGFSGERMLFNMSEDEWDAVIAVHLKGHFTVYYAMAIMRKQESGEDQELLGSVRCQLHNQIIPPQ